MPKVVDHLHFFHSVLGYHHRDRKVCASPIPIMTNITGSYMNINRNVLIPQKCISSTMFPLCLSICNALQTTEMRCQLSYYSGDISLSFDQIILFTERPSSNGSVNWSDCTAESSLLPHCSKHLFS